MREKLIHSMNKFLFFYDLPHVQLDNKAIRNFSDIYATPYRGQCEPILRHMENPIAMIFISFAPIIEEQVDV